MYQNQCIKTIPRPLTTNHACEIAKYLCLKMTENSDSQWFKQ